MAEYPGTPELHWQSWDYPRLPSPTSPLWQSIPVHRQSWDYPRTTFPPPFPPQQPCVRIPQNARVTPAVLGLSWDSLLPKSPVQNTSEMNNGVTCTWSYINSVRIIQPLYTHTYVTICQLSNSTSYSHYAAYIDIVGNKQSALYSYALLS